MYGLDTLQYYYNDMLAIAQQCPAIGGNAVFVMRGFINLFDPTITFDDVDICLQYGIYRKAHTKPDFSLQNEVRIIPNPASKNITIALKKFQSGICRIEIIDCFGIIQINNKSDCKSSDVLVNVSGLTQGIYFVKVYLNDSLISKSKLMVSK